MRFNSNCSCNQNSCNRRCNNGGNFQPYSNQSMGCGYNNGFPGMSRRPMIPQCQCNAFAASTTTPPQTVTGPTPTLLFFQNILYDYGCAIQAANGTSRINIVQPGLYQVNYLVVAENTGADATGVSTAILRNTTTVATEATTADIAAGATAVLTDTAIIYASCQDIPVAIALQVTNTGVDGTPATAATTVDYTVYITINRICSCNDACSGSVGANTSCFCGYKAGCGCYDGFDSFMPGPVDFMPGPITSGADYGFVNGLPRNNFGGGCNSSCNNGCGLNSNF